MFNYIKDKKFKFEDLELNDLRFYFLSSIFVLGNLLLPMLFHQVGLAGKLFLPIYMFVLIAGYKYGWKAGMLVGVLSPYLNHLITGMPPLYAIIKGVLLGVIAAVVAKKFQKITMLNLGLVIISYQVIGMIAESLLIGKLAFTNIYLAIPGMTLQLILGYVILKFINHHGN